MPHFNIVNFVQNLGPLFSPRTPLAKGRKSSRASATRIHLAVNTIASCVACSALLLSCVNEERREHHAIFNSLLSSSYAQFEKSFAEERSTLSFAEGTTASNCKSYFENSEKHGLDEAIHNQLVKSEYLICDALKILSESRPASSNTTAPAGRGKALAERLDLRTFPSSLRPAADDDRHTLLSLHPAETTTGANAAEANTPEWSWTLEVVAAAKVNDNDIEDWIVWLHDESTSGNYRNYQTLVIYDVETQKILTGQPYRP